MCKLHRSFLNGVALAAMLTVNQPVAKGQYEPTENPAGRAKADGSGKKISELEQKIADLQEGLNNKADKPPAPPKDKKKEEPSPYGDWWKYVLGVILAVIGGVLVYNRFLKEDEKKDDSKQPPPPPPAPTPSHKIVPIIGMLLFGFAGEAVAGNCFVTQVGTLKGDSKLPLLVIGQPNSVHCVTDAANVQVISKSGPMTVAVTKVADGFDFVVTPSASQIIRVLNGSVTIATLRSTDGYGAYLVDTSVSTVRAEFKPDIDNLKGAQADVWVKIYGPNGLNDKVSKHDTRIAALEGRPATTTVDMSAYDRRMQSMQAEIVAAKQEAAAAKAEALAAKKRVEELAQAKVKTGIFRSKTLREAADDAK